MAKVEMTAGELIESGLWLQVCNSKGWNPWIVNEGLMSSNYIVEFDDNFEEEEL